MSTQDRPQLARDAYGAYESGDRSVIEQLLTDDFTFYSPADVGIDRARYFERCWPNAELIEAYEFKRLIEAGDEVVVTYEARRPTGAGFATPRSSHLQATRSARRRSTSAGISSDRAGSGSRPRNRLCVALPWPSLSRGARRARSSGGTRRR